MDRRNYGSSSSRIPRGGSKRAPPPSAGGPSKMSRLATSQQRRPQILGPRRATQPTDNNIRSTTLNENPIASQVSGSSLFERNQSSVPIR